MAQIDELIVKVTGDIKDLKQKMSQASNISTKAFSKIQDGARKMGVAVGAAAGKMNQMGGVAAVGAAAGLAVVVKKSLDSADALAKLSGQLGISAEFLQEMRFAASQTGVAQGELDGALAKFTKNIGEANDGVATYADEFNKLGVSIKDNQGNLKSTEILFKEVADGVQGLDTDTERAATSFALFGRAGIKLTNTLKNGSAGLTKYQKEAQSLGIVIDGSILKGAEEANDKFDILSRVISTQVITAVVDLAPHLTEIASTLIEASQGAIQFSKDIGLISERDPTKKLNNMKVELIDLEQELMRLENSPVSFLNVFSIPKTRKEIEALKKDIASVESEMPKASADGDSGEKQKQDSQNEILKKGQEERAAIRAEEAAAKKEEASVEIEEKIARLEEENALLTEIDAAQNAEKIASNQAMMDELSKNENLSKEARLKISADRISKEREMQDAALGGLGTTFDNIMSLTKGKNKELFELSKAAAIATAIVQGTLGVQRALGSAPPPLNFITAAAVGTSAAVNVAKIQGTGFNQGTDSVPGIGNFDSVPAVLTPGERVVPKQTNKDLTSFLNNQGSSGSNVSITMNNNFNGLSFDTDEAKIQLAEALNDAVSEIGVKLQL